MSDFFKIIQLKFKLFNLRFKISKIYTFIVFYGFILSFLFLIHLIQFNFGEYEKVYMLKIFLLPIFTVTTIFPVKNSIEKARIKSFFGNFNSNKIDDFYLYKNYVITLIFILYILIPYSREFINTFLFCFTIWTFILLLILTVKLKYKSISSEFIRLFLCAIPIVFANVFGVNIKLKNFADSINIIFYIIFILANIFLSLKILRKLEKHYLNRQKFSRILINKSFVGYNFLYILRSGKFFSNLIILYTNFAVFILNQKQQDAILTFLGIIFAVNFVFLYSTLKIEEQKLKFLFEKVYIRDLLMLKFKDLTKLSILYLIFSLPAIIYKLGFLSIVFSIFAIFLKIIFNLILIIFAGKRNLILGKNFINLGIILYFIFLFIGYFLLIKLI